MLCLLSFVHDLEDVLFLMAARVKFEYCDNACVHVVLAVSVPDDICFMAAGVLTEPKSSMRERAA